MSPKKSISKKNTEKLAELFKRAACACESNERRKHEFVADIEKHLPELLASDADPEGISTLASIGIEKASFLLCACMIGSTECVQKLLAAGANPNAAFIDDNSNPATPLWALSRNRATSDDFFKLLIEAGADPFADCSQTSSPQYDPNSDSTPGPAILWHFFLGRAESLKACLDIATESQAMKLLRHLRDSQSWSAQARQAWTTHPILKSPFVIAEIERLQSGQEGSEYSALLAGVERDKLNEISPADFASASTRAPKRI